MSDEPEVTPALFDHAVRVYDKMLEASHKEFPVNEGGETFTESDKLDVYDGHLTRLFADLQIANPYYTKIKNALVAQGCIEQLRRGGGSATSKWIVKHKPDEETFRSIMERRHVSNRSGKQAILEQQVKDMRIMISGLQDRIERLEEIEATS